MSRFHDRFPATTPVFAMLHLKGDDREDRLARARREIDLLSEGGIDAVIVENYFGDTDDVVAVLDLLRAERPRVAFGINVLRDDWRSFALAAEYGAAFLQLDSVAGHLAVDDDVVFAERLAAERAAYDGLVLGGVRFKYQPYLSGRPLRADLELAVRRCDAIVVTGEGTGLPTPISKTQEFREIVGDDFPLVIGAGVTPANAAEQLERADAVIVGSALKDTLADTGDVSADHVAAFVAAIRAAERRTPDNHTEEQ